MPVWFSLPRAVSVIEMHIANVCRKCEQLYGETVRVEHFLPLGGKEVWTNRVRGWTYRVVEDWRLHGMDVGMREVWYWWDIVEVDVGEMSIA